MAHNGHGGILTTKQTKKKKERKKRISSFSNRSFHPTAFIIDCKGRPLSTARDDQDIDYRSRDMTGSDKQELLIYGLIQTGPEREHTRHFLDDSLPLFHHCHQRAA
ncbi:uncharacterized protein GLRG_02904 [Colletotrichum graminicola M1.001]|uniref:Uncharacterized protein n=1 Tax=Colletotrichum graminicola (strain M1.001 / M2 / FGSC 10212) TaxID=645133 RepID=E3QA72_COLGM|nr:uncharacterized protein GLRG_02904 [Colletotrichum graminicola M1.001]EFQ27760.1 hypothetical protein GLRG_02904 [Colletotrichum graminicola M1.001]